MAKKPPEHHAVTELVEKVQASFKSAEETFAETLKELTLRLTAAQHDAKKRLDEVLALVQRKDFSDLQEDALARVHALREEVEGKLDPQALFAALGLATKADVDAANRKIATLQKRVKELEGNKPRARRED